MSLYQRLGGADAISAVVDKFYQTMLKDQRVAHYYTNSDMKKLRIRQKQFITLVSGGPNNYEGSDMKTAHCKHSIGHMEFDATWENLEGALQFFKVPSKQIHELKQIFYSVQNQIVNKPQDLTQQKTLYEKLGGHDAVSMVVNKFYDFMLKDSRVSYYFANTNMDKQRKSQIEFISMVTGGPNNYHGKDMKNAHCPYKINRFVFDATWQNLQKAFKTFSVPQNLVQEVKQVFYSVESEIVNVNEITEKSSDKKCPASKETSSEQKTLYEKLGGHDAVSLVVNRFYDIMLKDPRVSYYFANTNMQKQRNSQIEFISMVTGGPNNYKGKDMKAAHCPYKIRNLEFDATWQNLQNAFKDFSVPQNLVKEVREVFYSVEDDIVTVKQTHQKQSEKKCPFSKQNIQNKQEQKTLYERLGGHDAVSLVVNKFYDFMLQDSRVSYYFNNTDMKKQRNSQIEFLSMVTGGPNNYHGKDMKAAHCPYKINHLEFDATWQNLQKALKTFSVPQNLVKEVKEIFYSVEGDIVHESEGSVTASNKKSSFISEQKSLYDRLGGHGAVYLVVNRFYDIMLEDPRVSFYFANTDMAKQRNSQIEFISMVTGGPNHYAGKDMKTAHCPYKISHMEFDATWENLEKAFHYFKVDKGLIKEVKDIFYSVEGDIVREDGQKVQKTVKHKDEVKQIQGDMKAMTISSQGLVPVTSYETSQGDKNHSGHYDQTKLMQCPHMAAKLKENNVMDQKISENQKRRLKQEVINKELQAKQTRKLNNCPYQKTYY